MWDLFPQNTDYRRQCHSGRLTHFRLVWNSPETLLISVWIDKGRRNGVHSTPNRGRPA